LGAWRQRLGEYEITNLGDDLQLIDRIRLIEERGFLMAEVNITEAPGQTLRIVLMPTSDTEALALETFTEGGEAVSVVTENGAEQLRFSGYHARKK
jgi:acyl transferase domain-containing protein